ncbi:MAG: murein biosynthesis integral membrane protein MurJ [Chthoniobacterales bacterium]
MSKKNSHSMNTQAAWIVSGAVMCSRVLGLTREIIVAALFGASQWMDAFIVAFRAPNLLRDLFAEGALSTAFITVFSQKIEKEGDRSAWELASKIATLAIVFMSFITLLGILFAPWVVHFLAPDFDGEKAAFATLLTRIMFPFILVVSLAALVMGMLNSKNIFGIPALASSFFNIGSIVGGLFFGWCIDPEFGYRALIGLAIGTLIGGLLQLLVQLPSLRKVGFVFRPDFLWRDKGVRRVLVLMIPSVIAGSAVQVNVMINTMFASYLQDGAISWLNYAFRLMQLPLGVFGVAVATVTLPVVSKIAVTKDWDNFRATLARAIRLATFLSIPSAAGLIILGKPIVSLIYERFRFGSDDTLAVGAALQFYAIGLFAYSCIKVLAPAFYAMNRKWTPMFGSFAAIALNVALNYLFIFHFNFGHRGLALSTAISATMNFALLYFLMRHHLRGMHSGTWFLAISKSLAGVAGLVGVAYAAQHYFGHLLLQGPLYFRIPAVLFTVGLAGIVYLLICYLLKSEEMLESAQILKSKLGRRLSRDSS